jgi:hypothetical protein
MGQEQAALLAAFEQELTWKHQAKEKCRMVGDNARFNILTTVLTIYALFGDDFRLLATYKYMDSVFNVFTIMCILVFTIEILVQSIGKEDYFWSFFFKLDSLSTVTLVLDLTWLGNALFCADPEGGSALKSSRAGRAGARAGRTVRVIRLLRLVKLYAKYQSAKQEKEKEAKAEAAKKDSSGNTARRGSWRGKSANWCRRA